MKSLKFEQRNLVLHGAWKWLLAEFASYYGVSDEYARLRYLNENSQVYHHRSMSAESIYSF